MSGARSLLSAPGGGFVRGALFAVNVFIFFRLRGGGYDGIVAMRLPRSYLCCQPGAKRQLVLSE